MVILALDTTGRPSGAAVLKDGRLISESYIDAGLTHSQTIMPAVERVLDDAALRPGDVDVYAAAIGPGSFTGIRIGVAAVKAMAQALDKPCAPVNALSALAANAPYFRGSVCPIMDARRQQVYTAVYRGDGRGRPKRVSEYQAVPLEQLLPSLEGDTLFLGDGVPVFAQRIAEVMGERAVFAPASHLLQRASSVALEAAMLAAQGRLVSCLELEPFYIRPSQAERLHGGA